MIARQRGRAALGRRTGLFLSSSSLALLLAAGSAQAVNECGVVANGGTAQCNALNFPNGIRYTLNNVTVNVGAPAGQLGAVTVNAGIPVHGIRLGSNAATGDQTLNVGANVTINNTNSFQDGIFAEAFSGNIFLTVEGDVNVSGGASSGIHARSSTGALTIISSGDIIHTGPQGDPIVRGAIFADNGNGSMVHQSGNILTTQDLVQGILDVGGGSRNVIVDGTITTMGLAAHGILMFPINGTMNAQVNGTITVNGTAAVAVNLSGGIDSSGMAVIRGNAIANGVDARGVLITGGLGAELLITATGHVQGGTGALGAGVELFNGGVNGPLVRNQGLITSLNDLAIRSALILPANDRIENSGTIVGYISTANGDDSFTNQAGGLWVARGGAVSFGADNDTVSNQAGALVSIVGSQTWNDLETFSNAGTLSLRDSDAGTFNSDPGAFETFSFGGDFVGGGGLIALDTQVGADGAPTDLVVFTGSVSGSGQLLIHNLGGAGEGTTGAGILVVDGSAAMGSLSLSLAQPLIFGALQYNLVEDSGQWFLRSGAFAGATDYPVILSSQLISWQAGLGPLHERLAGLRQSSAAAGQTAALGTGDLAETSGPRGAAASGAWMRAYWSDYDISPHAGADFSQDNVGFQAGYDFSRGELFAAEDRLFAGLFVGRYQADAEVDNSDTTVALEGTTLGAYVTYLAAAFHLDGVVKVDLGELDFDQPSSLTRANLDTTTWGLSLEAGYQFALESFYLEPQMQLSWVQASADDFSDVGGSLIDLQEGESLIGRLGVKVGTSYTTGGDIQVQPYIEAALRHEFLGESHVLAGAQTLSNDLSGTGGLVGGGVAVQSADGAYALVLSLDYNFGDTTEGLDANLAARVNW